ncbi:hypothetical protein [Pseudomonas oryzihabitans]|uniref:Uncharacterized protein n=1 Tax=Pseudomonas oryzihabitans TaxID=47885 RepID=A0A2Z5A7G7_9PSED|nr:hypothetical protein [Pseudomonas oryzihabitans]AXA66715.1 hypothetical protein CE139_13100 [Pseudomonas oryzihabitans]
MATPPSAYHPELTESRLSVIAEALLDIRFSTIRDLNTPYDSNYSREGTAFERSRNLIIEMCQSKQYDWLTLLNPGMDVTFCIGRVPCRFFRDDPEKPDKRGFFKRNAADDLFSENEADPVMWRFVVERAELEDDEDRAYFIGYNVYQEKVCQWSFGAAGPIIHSIGGDTPPSKPLLPAMVGLKDKSVIADDAANE